MDICGLSIPKSKITGTKAIRRQQAWLAKETAKGLLGWEQNKPFFLSMFTIFARVYSLQELNIPFRFEQTQILTYMRG